MKRLLLGLLLAAGLSAPCFAQGNVNQVPSVGTISSILKQYTYSSVSRGLAPAASATDIWCIAGSASRAVSVKRIRITGTAATLVTAPFTLLRRTTLDTGGTAATGAALPVATPNISSDPASVATLVAYTANPTINDSSPTYFRSAWATLPTTAAGTSINPLIWEFGEAVGWFTKALDIPKSTAGAATQYCINLNTVSVATGLVDIEATWIEQ